MQDYQSASTARLCVITQSCVTIHAAGVHNHLSRWWKCVRAQLVLSGVDGRRTP
jgi:hypothetical protein